MSILIRITIALLFSSCVFAPVWAEDSPTQAEPKKPVIAVMVSDDLYDADKLLPPLMEKLAKENGWEIAVIHGHGTANFPNIGVLEKSDALVIFIRRLALPTVQLDVVKKFIATGHGVVAIRTASHGFNSGERPFAEGCENWAAFDKEVLGCSYHGHGSNESGLEVTNVASLLDSPILKGVEPNQWHSESALYFCDPFKDDITVYQTASSPEVKDSPLTWTRIHGKTRVAYTSLGHQKDFEVKAFQVLLGNLVEWVRQPQQP